VITSPTGSVIRDILHRLSDRFPRHVLVWPVAVQGEQCAQQVTAAIQGFNALKPGGRLPRPDVIIVARGGGSLEDLWGFNEESVVRAAAASGIPLISAVGHETDTTLIDFAADRRAPTPTAAAEIAVPVKSELVTLVADYERRLIGAAGRGLEQRRTQVEGLARGLPDPKRLLEDSWQRLDDRAERLALGVERFLRQRENDVAELSWRIPHPRKQIEVWRERLSDAATGLNREGTRFARDKRREMDRLDAERRLKQSISLRQRDARQQLDELRRLLEGYSYQATVERGFAVVYADGALTTRARDIATGQTLDIAFADGRVPATAGEGAAPPAKPAPTQAKPETKSSRRKPKDDGSQGSLL
jgi:exodeoxyribonuclease VII large subunit